MFLMGNPIAQGEAGVLLRKYKAVCILCMRKYGKMSMQGPSIKDNEHLRCVKKVQYSMPRYVFI